MTGINIASAPRGRIGLPPGASDPAANSSAKISAAGELVIAPAIQPDIVT